MIFSVFSKIVLKSSFQKQEPNKPLVSLVHFYILIVCVCLCICILFLNVI